MLYISQLSLIQIVMNHNKKFELMLTRRTKSYSGYCLQIALVYLRPVRCNSLLKCQKLQKNNETHYFWSSWSFKVIDVDMTKKLVTSACCDRQHAHGDLQQFSQKTGQQW